MSESSLKQDTPKDDKELGDRVSERPDDTRIDIDPEIEGTHVEKSELRRHWDKNEHIIDILTEKQVEPIIESRQRRFWVYNGYRTGPIGEAMEYTSDRNKFVRNVFILVFSMLLVTSTFIYCVIETPEIKHFMSTKVGLVLLVVSMGVILGLNYAFCCLDCTRQFPCNYVILVIATVVYSYMAGFICARYAPYIVLGAAGTTLIVSFLCLILACTSFDFTKFLLIVIVAGIALAIASVGCGILTLVFNIKMAIVQLVILVVAAVVSSVSLIIELQMILGGRAVELGEEEYAFGAYMVYTSIIDIFLKLLTIINSIVNIDEIL